MTMQEYRDVLTNLRCDASLIKDSAFSGVRDVANRMLTAIDGALSSLPEPAVSASLTIDDLPSGLLVSELKKRLRANRHVLKLCVGCKSAPVRARDLCVHCYKKAYRRGEIKTDARQT